MPTIRCFIAVDTPPDLKEKIAEIRDKLRACGAEVRWESTEKFHITLKFLGNLDAGRLHPLEAELMEGLKSFSPFPLIYHGVGSFPSSHHPRVVWVGCEDRSGALGRIQAEVERVAEEFGIEKEERPFHAHVTIGRVKGSRNLKELVFELGAATFSPYAVMVNEVLLMKSDLKPAGSIYTVLRRFPLLGGTHGTAES
jgi:2'-5' RNA ligase